ncbi:hypothetical protein Tcan_07605 [Toxocara canis]|uniref:Uncharacterized protein n=1 Tax=Toxocara canis TaxID=6265 RepID=A0A0B2VFT4_TOXCA|nr:hypothetical protein Tcan_07605 [Toxocara canis]
MDAQCSITKHVIITMRNCRRHTSKVPNLKATQFELHLKTMATVAVEDGCE